MAFIQVKMISMELKIKLVFHFDTKYIMMQDEPALQFWVE